MHYYRWRLYGNLRLLYLLSFNADIFEHLGEITFPISAFLTRQYQTLCICFQTIFFAQFFIKKSCNVLVVNGSEAFMHTAHDSDVVVIKKIDLLHLEEHRQVALFVSEKELCNGLRNECHWN